MEYQGNFLDGRSLRLLCKNTFPLLDDDAKGNRNSLAYKQPKHEFFHFEMGFKVQSAHNSQIHQEIGYQQLFPYKSDANEHKDLLT